MAKMPIRFQAMPATKIIPAAININVVAVPKSSRTISPPKRARMPLSGRSVVVSSLIRSSRLARNEARNSTITGLANSAGCT